MTWYLNDNPINDRKLREAVAPTLLPKTLTDQHYLEAGAKKLVETDAPPHNPDTQRIFLEVMKVDGNPTQVWQVEDIPQSELEEQAEADFYAFAASVKNECERRIFKVASANTQQTLNMHATLGNLSEEQMTVLRAGMAWIDSCVAKSRALVANKVADYQDDKHWPAPTQEMIDLANTY
ncbi:hypothetical protein [Neptuniibacter sp.]|uniref:hypothetical protein n=1 Tax=Neptuniibacter sp. TaxID=1962643 RepID=UPI00261206B0|nr:hypothetical protein [Neptuniibacter sp.]MCP4595773.1 hypothetical protein [Neptuniibacter sp.]